MGIVIEDKNSDVPCRCYKLDNDGDLLCFKEGIVGVLDKKQEEEYCTVKKVDEDVEKLRKDVEGITEDITKAKNEVIEELKDDATFNKLAMALDKRFKKYEGMW